jgi:hypothetical protein
VGPRDHQLADRSWDHSGRWRIQRPRHIRQIAAKKITKIHLGSSQKMCFFLPPVLFFSLGCRLFFPFFSAATKKSTYLL